MVVKVALDGLNIVKARGKWYVYHRESRTPLLTGFKGSRNDLIKRLGMPDILAAYNKRQKRDLKRTYPPGTLGGLIQWFENECPEYQRLSEATKSDYSKAFAYLQPEWDAPLESITQPDLYEVRDKCAADKWPRFADKMIAALSAMFSRAVKRRKMEFNPAKGIEKVHRADPNANREWSPPEWEAARAKAPPPILIPMMLARHAGFRGQTIQALDWGRYQPDPEFGKCFRLVARKNNERTWIPATSELQDFLDGMVRTSVHIATRADGTPWETEVQMQTAVSHFLKQLERDGTVGKGVTLHGLRVTYAADLRRNGANTSDVSAALGDRSERMGEHYTRHVENEQRVIRAFRGKRRLYI